MVNLCPECFEADCSHEVDKFECDDLMVYPLQVINRKGYRTEFCCSGHVEVDTFQNEEGKNEPLPKGIPTIFQQYVLFDKMYWVDPPEGWEFRIHKATNRTMIEKESPIMSQDHTTKSQLLLEGMVELTNWVQTLEPWNGELLEVTMQKLKKKGNRTMKDLVFTQKYEHGLYTIYDVYVRFMDRCYKVGSDENKSDAMDYGKSYLKGLQRGKG